jgi:hypothetical protein
LPLYSQYMFRLFETRYIQRILQNLRMASRSLSEEQIPTQTLNNSTNICLKIREY